jgi:hypothetical protein
MRVMVACEFSGIVRDAFRARGHDAWSCDLLPTERPSPYHLEADIRMVPLESVDLLIAHPPCRYLARSGARWWKGREAEQEAAIAFVEWLFAAPVCRIAIENPRGILSTAIGPPTQVIQPWWFGHPELKATCFWLKNLAPLRPTTLTFALREARVHREHPGPDRWRRRARTLPGLAAGMAAQWGDQLDERPVASRHAPT